MTVGVAPSLIGRIRGFRPTAWYRFGVGLTVAGGLVSRWDDFSGNKRPLLQATGANQPAADGKGGITCDGSATFMQAAFTLANGCTIGYLLNQVAWTSGNVIADGGTSGAGVNGALVQTSGSPQLNLNCGSAACPATGAVIGKWITVIAVCNTTSSFLFTEQVSATAGSAGSNALGGITLGASADGSTKFGNCGFREVVVFNSVFDDTRIRTLRQYLQAQRSTFYN